MADQDLAAQVAAHDAAISQLQSAPVSSEAASQPRTFVIGAQGVLIGEMNYQGAWDAFFGYATQAVVRFAKQTWVCISPVKEKIVGVLGPIAFGVKKHFLETDQPRLEQFLRSAEPGELKEDVIQINNPVYIHTAATYFGQCIVYQVIGNGEAATITNPNIGREGEANGSFVHTDVFNEAGTEVSFESWTGGFATTKTNVLPLGQKCYVVMYMTQRQGGEGGENHVSSPVPRAISWEITGVKAGPAGNVNPEKDQGHWAKIADAKGTPGLTEAEINALIKSKSATGFKNMTGTAKVGIATGLAFARAREILAGAAVELSGAVEVKEEVKAGETIATIKEIAFPPQEIQLNAGAVRLKISNAGVITATTALTIGTVFTFEGLIYSTT